MKPIQRLSIFAAVALLLGANNQTWAAASTNKLNVNLAFYLQGPTTDNGNSTVEVTKQDKQQVVTKSLLYLLASITGNSAIADAGTYIEVDGNLSLGPTVVVKDKTGNLVQDVTTNFDISVTSTNIYTGRYNTDNLSAQIKNRYILRLQFHDGIGNDFDVSGLAQDNYNASPEKNSMQQESGTVQIVVSGTGHISAQNAMVQGSVKLSGKSVAHLGP